MVHVGLMQDQVLEYACLSGEHRIAHEVLEQVVSQAVNEEVEGDGAIGDQLFVDVSP